MEKGVYNKVIYGEARPQGPNRYLIIYTIFDKKGNPFIWPATENGTTFTCIQLKPQLISLDLYEISVKALLNT